MYFHTFGPTRCEKSGGSKTPIHAQIFCAMPLFATFRLHYKTKMLKMKTTRLPQKLFIKIKFQEMAINKINSAPDNTILIFILFF